MKIIVYKWSPIGSSSKSDQFCCDNAFFHRELGDFEAAMESFQKALMLNQNHIQSLQLRGMMLYHHGTLQEALKDFKVFEYIDVF